MFVNFNILNQLGSPAINSNTFANRPAAGQTGRLFVSTDTFEIYRDNGTTWDLIGGPGSSTITGTGTATQVAYFTSSQAIGSSANLYWDNTNGYLGVNTATPGAAIEAVKTDGYGIYANYTTNVGSGASTTAIYAINNTASSGYAAVIEEKTGNTTGGQYPLLVKHSLSSGTAAVGNGTGLQFQLQDDAGTFKTTQLTIETIDAAAATYATRYRFNVQSAGSSTPAAYLNATGLGLGTATPGAKLDIHSTGTLAQFNSTGATNNGYIAFQRAGTTTFSIGDTYNGGSNYFRIFSNSLSADIAQIFEATGKTVWQSTQAYSTGLARGNYFDYNLSVPAGASFSSPNAITALGASLDLTLAGNATIPSGARSGLDAYNSVSFTGAGTLTMTQGTQIRPYSNVTAGWAFNGSATGTITHLAGLRVLFPDNSGSAVSVTNNYGLLINDQTANTGTVTYTNRWGIYQEGASDLNYFNANTLFGTTTNVGAKINVNGKIRLNNDLEYSTVGGTVTGIIFGDTNNLVFRQQSTAGFQFQSSAGGNFMTLNTGGNLGIGIIPAARLDFTTSGQTLMRAEIPNVAQLNIGNGGNSINYYDANTQIFRLGNGTEQMRLNSTGLGIGTTNPATNLELIGTYRQKALSTNSNGFNLSINSSTDVVSLTNFYNAAMTFGTNNTERARFTAGGNFLIGTTTDAGYKLDVTGGNTILRGGTLFQGAAGPVSTTISQKITGTSTAGSTTVAKKIIYCDHTHSINVKVIAYQSTANNASITQDFCASYGVSSTANVVTTAVGNVTAISLAYNNGGSPSYTIDCTVTYTGTAPTLYIIVSGISRDNMYII